MNTNGFFAALSLLLHISLVAHCLVFYKKVWWCIRFHTVLYLLLKNKIDANKMLFVQYEVCLKMSY